jgi:DNA-binding CsgD family transcriptional regulator
MMDVLTRIPEEELNRLIEALGPGSPENPIWELWIVQSIATSFAELPEEYREKCARAGPLFTKIAKELSGRTPLWAAALLSLLVKAHPWFHGGAFGLAMRRSLRRLVADVRKQKKGRNQEIIRRKREGQTLGQIALGLGMSLEAVKGAWKRHKPNPT